VLSLQERQKPFTHQTSFPEDIKSSEISFEILLKKTNSRHCISVMIETKEHCTFAEIALISLWNNAQNFSRVSLNSKEIACVHVKILKFPK
jgi:hypothetical protein